MKEREVKLSAGEGFELPDLSGMHGAVASPRAEHVLSTVYLDSDDLRLARWGLSFRHRAGQGWTVKLPGDAAGVLLVRDEVVFKGKAGTAPAAAVKPLFERGSSGAGRLLIGGERESEQAPGRLRRFEPGVIALRGERKRCLLRSDEPLGLARRTDCQSLCRPTRLPCAPTTRRRSGRLVSHVYPPGTGAGEVVDSWSGPLRGQSRAAIGRSSRRATSVLG
jgi:hypothetical protein